ncbi:MAG: hypothetical protein ACKVVP_12605 [Chloroflexota bacterium]
MTIAVGIVIVLIAIAFVLLPLFRRTSIDQTESTDPAVTRASLYQQILDAELDTQLGKLDGTDYAELRARLMSEAAQLITTSRSDGAVDEDTAARVEREIAAARAALRGSSGVRTSHA